MSPSEPAPKLGLPNRQDALTERVVVSVPGFGDAIDEDLECEGSVLFEDSLGSAGCFPGVMKLPDQLRFCGELPTRRIRMDTLRSMPASRAEIPAGSSEECPARTSSVPCPEPPNRVQECGVENVKDGPAPGMEAYLRRLVLLEH